MKKTCFIACTVILMSLGAGRPLAQVPQAPPAAPRPADVSAPPEVKARHVPDSGFARKALAAGRKEVASATFAGLTASSPEVKALASRLVKDHTTANQELDQMMREKKYDLREKRPSTKSESWRTEKGVSFDRAYVEYVIDEHEDAIELFEDQATKGTDAALKAWAAAQLPGLREHLTMARELKDKLGS
jgi:putative membrane protein